MQCRELFSSNDNSTLQLLNLQQCSCLKYQLKFQSDDRKLESSSDLPSTKNSKPPKLSLHSISLAQFSNDLHVLISTWPYRLLPKKAFLVLIQVKLLNYLLRFIASSTSSPNSKPRRPFSKLISSAFL